jgi:hypothetical protein
LTAVSRRRKPKVMIAASTSSPPPERVRSRLLEKLRSWKTLKSSLRRKKGRGEGKHLVHLRLNLHAQQRCSATPAVRAPLRVCKDSAPAAARPRAPREATGRSAGGAGGVESRERGHRTYKLGLQAKHMHSLQFQRTRQPVTLRLASRASRASRSVQGRTEFERTCVTTAPERSCSTIGASSRTSTST